jgi:hypothetical protein
MKKAVLIILAFIVCDSFCFGNEMKGTVKGFIIDSVLVQPITKATVSVINEKDSSLVSYTISANNGYFEINNLDTGNYVLLTTFQGLETIRKPFTITLEKDTIDFAVIKMVKAYKILDEVTVRSEAKMKISDDTIGYRADAFKTRPNATVEDLLKKLPGVQVKKDGTVKAQGEQVQKVYVDGKEFFDNDPKMATKNLSAEMIDEVQVYDGMSEQSKFMGIEDGSKFKAINLKLKKDKKQGVIGKAYAGYGTDARYNAGLSATYLNGSSQIALFGNANNVNGMDYTSTGSSGTGLGGTSSGITSTSSAGINYRDSWTKDLVINGSYFFNNSNTVDQTSIFRQRLLTDSTIVTDQKELSGNNQHNHRFNLNLTYIIDSLNSIIYTSNVNIQNVQLTQNNDLSDYVNHKDSKYNLMDNRIMNNSNTAAKNLTNNLLWRRKFERPGRTFLVSLQNISNKNDRNVISHINSKFYNSSEVVYKKITRNYKIITPNQTSNYTAALAYTEPLSADKVLVFNYSFNKNNTSSDRNTLNYNVLTKAYDKLVDSLSNDFNNINTSHLAGVTFRQKKKKYNYQLGFSVQQIVLESQNITNKTNFSQHNINLFPTASFNYQFARGKSFRFSYRGNTNQPTIFQLQDVTDVINYPYIRRGNPGLKQEFTHNLTFNYKNFAIAKMKTLSALFTLSQTSNKITNSIEQRAGGEQIIRPVNLNGSYNARGNINLSLPVGKERAGKFDVSTNINYSRDANLINTIKNFTSHMTVIQEFGLTQPFGETIEVGLNASLSYNLVHYSFQKFLNNSYYTYNYSFDFSFTSPAGFIFSTDAAYTAYKGRSVDFNQEYILWNASIGYADFQK